MFGTASEKDPGVSCPDPAWSEFRAFGKNLTGGLHLRTVSLREAFSGNTLKTGPEAECWKRVSTTAHGLHAGR